MPLPTDLPVLPMMSVIDWLRGKGTPLSALKLAEAVYEVIGYAIGQYFLPQPMAGAAPTGVPADDEALASALECHLPATVATVGAPVGAFPWAALLPVLLDLLQRLLPRQA